MKAWNRANIHRFGAMKPARQLLRDATGEAPDAGRYIDYLREKYAQIYGQRI